MEYAPPPAGFDGFDPAHFQMGQIPTPSWASGARTWGEDVPGALRGAVLAQEDEIRRATEAALYWGLTDKEAIRRFWPHSSYANGVDGTYFTGRQHVTLDGGEKLLVETECCLCGVNQRGEQYVYDRYLILLRWDPATHAGENVLMGDAERASVLATPPLHLDAPERPGDLADFASLPAEGQALLARRWPDVRACLLWAAAEIMADASSSGTLDNHHFPSRLQMTGTFSIRSMDGDQPGQIGVMLAFPSWPSSAGDTSESYLGYDLSITVDGEGPLGFELYGSMAL